MRPVKSLSDPIYGIYRHPISFGQDTVWKGTTPDRKNIDLFELRPTLSFAPCLSAMTLLIGYVFSTCGPPKITNVVIGFVSIIVGYLMFIRWRRAYKVYRNQSMHTKAQSHSTFREAHAYITGGIKVKFAHHGASTLPAFYTSYAPEITNCVTRSFRYRFPYFCGIVARHTAGILL